MAARAFVMLLVALVSVGSSLRVTVDSSANPIRRVVSMLQAMQKKVAAEGEKEKELMQKFKCYCSSSGGALSESIAAAKAKGPAVSSDIEQAEAQEVQFKEDLKQHQADRAAAKKAVSAATALREKEAAAFASEKNEADSNIAAVNSAVAALEKGMAGAFVQTGGAQVLRRLALSKQDLLDADRQELLAFLSGAQGSGYSPQGGEIVGILKQMGESMSKSLADASAAEEAAIKTFDELVAAKKKEEASLTASIETKTQRVGELAVSIVQMKNDLSDTQAALLEDQKFLADMDKNCAAKEAEYDERVKTRSEELQALAETIKILNDDDALELFKQTLPSAAASFVQVVGGSTARALSLVQEARKTAPSPQLDFIALALKGKNAGFEKVTKMIDAMIGTLKDEQVDDDNKKEYCATQFDSAEDKQKTLERAVSDAEAAIADAEEGIATVKEEIAALEAGIKALDKSVAEATEQRQKEHAEFNALMSSDSAAKELLGLAKNRLNKFYNKALYKAPPKRELSEEDRIAVNMGGTAPATAAPGGIAGTGVTVLAQKGAPPPPPETFGAYAKMSGESQGVIAMIDLLVKDLDKEMTEAKTQEKDSQADYEAAMGDSAAKRAQDAKTLTAKTATKADLEADLEAHTAAKGSTSSELMATSEFIASLHAECDWLVQHFDARKEARAGEVDSLGKAKAILAGADFSF
jgi:septal ring factor EnvC (AmiA/AmiB activator)